MCIGLQFIEDGEGSWFRGLICNPTTTLRKAQVSGDVFSEHRIQYLCAESRTYKVQKEVLLLNFFSL